MNNQPQDKLERLANQKDNYFKQCPICIERFSDRAIKQWDRCEINPNAFIHVAVIQWELKATARAPAKFGGEMVPFETETHAITEILLRTFAHE